MSTIIIDEFMEDKILACLYRVSDFCVVTSQHVKASYFSTPVRQNMAKMAVEFFQKYEAVLSAKSFTSEILDLVKVKKAIKKEDAGLYIKKYEQLKTMDVADWKYIMEKLIVFIKHKETRKLIETSVSRYLPKNDFEAIEKGMVAISNITTNADVKPYDYFSNESIDERLARRKAESELERVGISTGIPKMDAVLAKGGWYRKEMYIIMAPPKRGKTMSLLWFSNVASYQGFNVALFSFETSREVLSDRLDAMNTMIETKALVRATHISKILKDRRAKGKLLIYEYPTKTCTVAEMERQCRKLEVEDGVRLDMIVADYGDIMKPMSKYNDKLHEQASIFEDLRRLAGKFNVPLLTATQVNRSGTGKAMNTGTDVAGTYEKIMVADSVISLSATEAELKANKLRVIFAESRNNEKKSMLIETKFNFGRFFGDFLEEEES